MERNGGGVRVAAGYPQCEIFAAQKAFGRSLGPESLSVSNTQMRSPLA